MPESKRTSVRQSVHFCPAGPAIPASCSPIKEVSSPPCRHPPHPRLSPWPSRPHLLPHQLIFLPLQHLVADGLHDHSCVGIQRVHIQGQHLGVLLIGGDLHLIFLKHSLPLFDLWRCPLLPAPSCNYRSPNNFSCSSLCRTRHRHATPPSIPSCFLFLVDSPPLLAMCTLVLSSTTCIVVFLAITLDWLFYVAYKK